MSGLSLGADVALGVGEGKSLVELVTGKDPITGEPINRGVAALGLIPVVGRVGKIVVKGGKVAVKGGKVSATVAKKMDAHWRKHKNEFPEFKNAEEYARAAKEFIEKPPPGTRTFTRRGDGATLRYDPKTNTFGIKHKDGEIGTFFRPKNGEDYWSRQIAKEKL